MAEPAPPSSPAHARRAPVPGHRDIRRLAGPIILSNLSTPLLGAVDTAVMGHLPDAAYLGAVAVGSVIFSFLYWGFGFLRMGTTGFTAQAHGAGDADELRACLGRPLILAAALGLLLIALQWPIGRTAFALMDASEQVEGLAGTYFAIRIWSAPFALTNYAVLGWLLGTQRARHALALQVVLNGINIALDLLFVVGLGYTVGGVAAASLFAEMAAAALGLGLCAHLLRGLGGRWSRRRLLARDALVRLFRVNRDIFIRTLSLIFAFAYFTARGAQFGETTLAANAVLMQFQNILSFGLDGFAHAAETLVGSAVGARDRRAFSAAVRSSTLWAAGLALLFAAVLALAGPALLALFTDIPEVRARAETFLPWMIASPFVSIWAFQLDGVFIGATRTRAMRNAMLACLAIYLAGVWTFTPVLGNHGLWLALILFLGARGASLALAYPALVRSLR